MGMSNPTRNRTRRRRLAFSLATALTAGTATVLCTPLHAAAGVSVPIPPTIITIGGVGTPGVPSTQVYTLTLSASDTHPVSGEVVAVTATASPDIPAGYHIDLYEFSSLVPPQIDYETACYQDPCPQALTHSSGTYLYEAFLDDDPNSPFAGFPPTATSIIAAAAPIAVTWSNPSGRPSTDDCNPPTLKVLGGQDGGFDHTLNVTVGTTQTAVCFRLDNTGGGIAVGGAILVTTPVSPAVPTILPGNQCLAAPQGSNDLTELPHPLSNPQVAGQTLWYIDTYRGAASTGDVWVCVTSQSVAETVVVPIGLGTLPGVTFQPDPDSIVQ